MDKHVVIVVVASIVIAIPFVFSAWNIYSAEQIQLIGFNQEKFSYFDTINNGKISVCNPLPFYVTFNKIDIIMIFDQTGKGTLSIHDVTLPPSSITNLEGEFSSEIFVEAQYLSLHFDGMFSGSAPLRIDPSRFDIVTEMHTPIMGVIPYSISKQYSGLDFWNMMNDQDGQSNCKL